MEKHHKYVDAHLRASSAAENIRRWAERGELIDLQWAEEMCQHIDLMDEMVRPNVVQYTR